MIFYPIMLLFLCIIILLLLLLLMIYHKIFPNSDLFIRYLIMFACVFIFTTLNFAFIARGLHNADGPIGGLAGTAAAIRLELPISSYVEISDSPTKLLVIQNGDLNPDLSVFFDGDFYNSNKGGWGTRNGVRYSTTVRPFTRRYAVVTLTPR